MYNTQTSTQQHHLNSVHKEFEKEKLVRQHYRYAFLLQIDIY